MVNGARLPNWAWLLALGALLGVQAAAVYFGQDKAVTALTVGQKEQTRELVAALAKVAERDSLRTTDLDKKVDRRTQQINAELHQISVKTGYIARQVE